MLYNKKKSFISIIQIIEKVNICDIKAYQFIYSIKSHIRIYFKYISYFTLYLISFHRLSKFKNLIIPHKL